MKLRYLLPSIFSAALMAGCGTNTAFKSVPGPEENKGADANTSADASGQPGTATEGSGEDANGSDGTGKTVVVGVGETPNSPDASVMTVSIGDDSTESTAENGEPLPSNTDIATNQNETDADDGTDVADATDKADEGSADPENPANTDKKDHNAGDDVVDKEKKDKLTKKAAMECTGSSDVPVEKIKVVSSENTVPVIVKADEYLAIHITGNKNIVKLNTANAENAKVKGICVFIAGNQARFEAALGINVGSLVYFGTGNRSVGTVAVSEAVTIDSITTKLRGNQVSLTIKGDGKYDCGTADNKGNGNTYDCGN